MNESKVGLDEVVSQVHEVKSLRWVSTPWTPFNTGLKRRTAKAVGVVPLKDLAPSPVDSTRTGHLSLRLSGRILMRNHKRLPSSRRSLILGAGKPLGDLAKQGNMVSEQTHRSHTMPREDGVMVQPARNGMARWTMVIAKARNV